MLNTCLRTTLTLSIAATLVGDLVPVPKARLETSDFCKKQNTPVTHGFAYPHIGLKVLSHELSVERCAVARIKLKNESRSDLQSITLLIEYMDAKNRVMFSIPFFAGIKGVRNQIRTIKPFYERELARPVEPGGIVWIEGTNLLQVGSFPSHGRISAIHATFEDGSVHNSHGFRSDPILEATPPHILLSADGELPDEVLLSMLIDTKGRVVEVEEQSASGLSSYFLQQLRNEVQKWSFFPAIEMAFAVESRLQVQVRFHPQRFLPARECAKDRRKLPEKYAVVDLERTANNHWIIHYGFYSVAGGFPSQILVGGNSN